MRQYLNSVSSVHELELVRQVFGHGDGSQGTLSLLSPRSVPRQEVNRGRTPYWLKSVTMIVAMAICTPMSAAA